MDEQANTDYVLNPAPWYVPVTLAGLGVASVLFPLGVAWYFVQMWDALPQQQRGSFIPVLAILVPGTLVMWFLAVVIFRQTAKILRSGFDTSAVAKGPRTSRWAIVAKLLAFTLLAVFMIDRDSSIQMILAMSYVVLVFLGATASVWRASSHYIEISQKSATR